MTSGRFWQGADLPAETPRIDPYVLAPDGRRAGLEFPPHWTGTTIKWTLTANDAGGTHVHFNHDDWAADEGMFGMTAYTWGQLLGVLRNYVESGVSQPMFVRASA